MSLALYGAHSGVINDLLASQSLFNRAIVDETSLLAPTLTTGTPAAGVFYSSIPGRASIPDISKNLRVSFGLERVQVQQIYQIQNEFGSNGEPVWGAVGDDRGLVRFVGGWTGSIDNNGQYAFTASTTDYVEVTFYGTALNMCIVPMASGSVVAAVNGGVEGSNIVASLSTVLGSRNYSSNTVISVVSGLSLGIYTVRIRNNAAAGIRISGFEVLNTSSAANLTINQGSAYLNGIKKNLSAQSTSLLAKPATVTGGRGGRVVTYLGADNNLGQAVQLVDASSLFLTNANHANEEIARTYHWREFGAGRSDDFSTFSSGTALSRVFTLEDGTTTLIGGNVRTSISSDAIDCIFSTTTGFISFTFVGTGLDVTLLTDASTRSFTSIGVDGSSSIGTISKTGNTGREIRKIVSGLPYGTHTVSFFNTSSTQGSPSILNFIVYQPKKPSIPTGSVELADHNVMADFVANAVKGSDTLARGVLKKSCAREFVAVGTWTINQQTLSSSNGSTSGWYLNGTTAGNYAEYTFFGTGFDLRMGIPGVTAGNYTMTINGLAPSTTNFPGSSTGFYGNITGFTASTGVVTTNTGNDYGSGVWISGLSLGIYRVRLAYNSGSAMAIESIDIITPIHSHVDKTIAFQNTLPTGSCSMKDLRKTKVLPDRNISRAVGVVNAPSVGTTFAPCPDMSVTQVNTTGKIRVSFYTSVGDVGNFAVGLAVYVNGVIVSPSIAQSYNTTTGWSTSCGIQDIFFVPIGVNKIDVYFRADASPNAYLSQTKRSLVVEEV